jgi:hypothetical protein
MRIDAWASLWNMQSQSDRVAWVKCKYYSFVGLEKAGERINLPDGTRRTVCDARLQLDLMTTGQDRGRQSANPPVNQCMTAGNTIDHLNHSPIR